MLSNHLSHFPVFCCFYCCQFHSILRQWQKTWNSTFIFPSSCCYFSYRILMAFLNLFVEILCIFSDLGKVPLTKHHTPTPAKHKLLKRPLRHISASANSFHNKNISFLLPLFTFTFLYFILFPCLHASLRDLSYSLITCDTVFLLFYFPFNFVFLNFFFQFGFFRTLSASVNVMDCL